MPFQLPVTTLRHPSIISYQFQIKFTQPVQRVLLNDAEILATAYIYSLFFFHLLFSSGIECINASKIGE